MKDTQHVRYPLPKHEPREPWFIIRTGEEGWIPLSMIPMQAEICHWQCLHCGHRDDTDLTSQGAWFAARRHFIEEHGSKMAVRGVTGDTLRA